MSETPAFWVDEEYDRDNASNGHSRYAAYVRQGTFDPFDDQGTAVELAEFAWRRATGPVMAPGYVRCHPRILSAHVNRSDWDGSLIAAVDILTPMQDSYRRGVKGIGYWHDWPSEHSFFSDREVFHEPGGDELARSPYLLASVSLRFTVPDCDLPVPDEAGADIATCKQAISVLVRELNVIVGPVLARIEGS